MKADIISSLYARPTSPPHQCSHTYTDRHTHTHTDTNTYTHRQKHYHDLSEPVAMETHTMEREPQANVLDHSHDNRFQEYKLSLRPMGCDAMQDEC